MTFWGVDGLARHVILNVILDQERRITWAHRLHLKESYPCLLACERFSS